MVFALAIGVLLLATALDNGDGEVATTDETSTTATSADASTTSAAPDSSSTTAASTTSTHPAAEVKVLVLNGRDVQGIAGANTEVLLSQGYNALAPGNAPTTETTTVYFADPTYQDDATAIASALGITNVADLAGVDLGVDTQGANVIVVLGTDGAGNVTA